MRRYLAEAVGTFVLVFGGVGSAVPAGSHIGFVGVSFAFGLSLLAMVYTIGPVSGCHVNPTVTLGVLLTRKMSIADAFFYMFAQVAGAILAAGLVLFIASRAPGGYLAAAQTAWARTDTDSARRAATQCRPAFWRKRSWPCSCC